jgi:hypothetical protein
MDLRRLRAGEWITAGSGAALLASLFLPWYEDGEADLTGWQALGAIDVVVAVIAAAAVALLVVTATQRVPAVPVMMDALVTLAGIVAALLVLIRALDLPAGATGRDWALWIGLAGALGIVLGGAVAMRDERLSPPGTSTDATGRPAPPPPEPEPIAAPRSEAAR